jgi:hypothetical protein
MLFQNSDVSGLIILFSTLLFIIGLCIYFVKKSFTIGNLYINDGGDASVPCMLSFVIIFLIVIFVSVHGLMVGVFKPEIPLLQNLMYLCFIAMMLRGRILGYPMIHIDQYKKMIFLLTGGILFIISIVASTTSYNSNLIHSYNGYLFYHISYFLYVSLSSIVNNMIVSVILFITSGIIAGLILYIDVKEKRGKKIIRQDYLFFAVSFIHLIFSIAVKEFQFFINTPIPTILILFIFAVIFIHFKFETDLIISRTKKTNTLIQSIKDSIKSIYTKNTPYNNADKCKVSRISKMIKEDSDGEIAANVLCYPKWINSKKREILDCLNDIQKSYDDKEAIIDEWFNS